MKVFLHRAQTHAGRYQAFAVIAFISLSLNGCIQKNGSGQRAPSPEIIVAAAADLGPAFEELGKEFEQETGIKVTFSFGSTGTLAKQIENGMPVDLFAAANIEYVDALESQGLILPETKTLYARGRITIWTRADSPLKIERLEDLAKPEIHRIAIANPEHAPYGKAAREALESVGAWKTIERKLVFGENVRQALQYAETGNADAAITALSLSVQSAGRWVLVPEELHKPLAQGLAVIRSSEQQDAARRFGEFITSAKSRPTLRKYGFIPMGPMGAEVVN
jgi:molybdate transport system substrate-binding protein